jgi:hypothetical protein
MSRLWRSSISVISTLLWVGHCMFFLRIAGLGLARLVDQLYLHNVVGSLASASSLSGRFSKLKFQLNAKKLLAKARVVKAL